MADIYVFRSFVHRNSHRLGVMPYLPASQARPKGGNAKEQRQIPSAELVAQVLIS